MPLSCCAALSSITVRSCQRTLRSVKSSQGFLAWRPAKLFFSFWMPSSSPSQSAPPCSCLRAADRKTHDTHDDCKSYVLLIWSGCFYESYCSRRFQPRFTVRRMWSHAGTHTSRLIVSASGASRQRKSSAICNYTVMCTKSIFVAQSEQHTVLEWEEMIKKL